MPNNETRSKIAYVLVLGICGYGILDLVLSYFFESSKTESDHKLIVGVFMGLLTLLGLLLGSSKNDDDNDPKTT